MHFWPSHLDQISSPGQWQEAIQPVQVALLLPSSLLPLSCTADPGPKGDATQKSLLTEEFLANFLHEEEVKFPPRPLED